MIPSGGSAGDPDRLAFDAVSVDYGRSRVLSRVSFACRAGSLTGIFGPNGAGKTTLLRLASGRARASRGRGVYGDGGGTPSAAMPGRIGWLGHDPGLYPELTAAENLRFFAALHGVPDPDARVGEALDLARLRDRAGDPVGSFSRGMRQRIGLERALIAAPRVVLLDEPFTGLDEVSSQLLLARLAALRDAGAIVLLSTHDPGRIEGLLDAAMVLRGGRLIAQLPAGPGLAAAIAAAQGPDVAPIAGLSGEAAPDAVADVSSEVRSSAPGDAGRTTTAAPHAARGGTIAAFLRVAGLVAHKDALVELR